MTTAYLDAGTGSLIASAIVGGVAGAGVAVKHARHRLASKFSRKQRQDVGAGPEATIETDPATAKS